MRVIEIVDYDASWADLFLEESGLLHEALGHVALKIHHVGSTSVPGLAAKPIIDTIVEVGSLEHLDDRNADVRALGYNPIVKRHERLALDQQVIDGRRVDDNR